MLLRKSFDSNILILILKFNCQNFSQNIYNLVGNPIKGSPMYGSLAQMMRVYVGITTRSTDINYRDTYRVLKIKSVIYFI